MRNELASIEGKCSAVYQQSGTSTERSWLVKVAVVVAVVQTVRQWWWQ